jgi:hypothetical protein
VTGRKSPLLAGLPLFAAFLAAPLAVLAAKLAGQPEALESLGPRGLGLWLGLAGLAALLGLRRSAGDWTPADGRSRIWPRLLAVLVLAALAFVLLRLFGPALARAEGLAPLLEELKLPALLAFAGLWAWNFGAPAPAALVRLGAGLGAMTLLDFLLTAIMAQRLVLGGGYLFGESGGMADILAFLLCLAYCATLAPAQDGGDGGETDGAPRSPLARWLILGGLLATFSRPGLAAAAVISLCHDDAPVRERLAVAAACAIGVWMSLTLPLPRIPGPGEDLGLAWYWAATGEAMRQDPLALLLGLPLDSPMALAMPDVQGGELLPELDGLPVSVFEIPVSALRLTAAWGLAAPLLLFAGAGWCAWRGRSRFGLGLVSVLIVCAGLSPVLHVPATAVAAALALFAAARTPRRDGADGPKT